MFKLIIEQGEIVNTPATVRLCELSTTLEQDWRNLYTSAFPLAEQEPEQKLQQLMDKGQLLYHRTVGKQGELLCFSMVSLAPDFALLAYIATDPKQRSGGYGSKHLRALIDLLKKQYPNYLGMLLEIESTNPRLIKLSDDDKNQRQRRLAFYRRMGSKRLCRGMQYLVPTRSGDGFQEMDLLYFKFAAQGLDHKEKSRLVSELYQRFYLLSHDDATVLNALQSISSCTHHACEEESPEQGSGSAPAAQPSGAEHSAGEKKAEKAGQVKVPELCLSAKPPAVPKEGANASFGSKTRRRSRR